MEGRRALKRRKVKASKRCNVKSMGLQEAYSIIDPLMQAGFEAVENCIPFEIPNDAILKNVPGMLVERLHEAYTALKSRFNTDTGTLYIEDLRLKNHRMAKFAINHQLDSIFESRTSNFMSGYGAYMRMPSENNQMASFSVCADASLDLIHVGTRLVFDFERNSATIIKIDARMRRFMKYLPTCTIGIGLKCFPEKYKNQPIQAVLLLYHKINNQTKVVKVIDIGQQEISDSNRAYIQDRICSRITTPNANQRIRFDEFYHYDGRPYYKLVAPDPAFYKLTIDSKLLHANNPATHRSPLVLDFFEVLLAAIDRTQYS